jgi:transcriptional regulator with XRE-family HTH domain
MNELTNDVYKQNFGKFVCEQRKHRGMTQQALGEAVNLSTKSISCIERGLHYPSLANLFDIAKVLDMSLDEFLYGYKRFQIGANFTKIDDKIGKLTPDNQTLLLSVVQALTDTLLLQQNTKMDA